MAGAPPARDQSRHLGGSFERGDWSNWLLVVHHVVWLWPIYAEYDYLQLARQPGLLRRPRLLVRLGGQPLLCRGAAHRRVGTAADHARGRNDHYLQPMERTQVAVLLACHYPHGSPLGYDGFRPRTKQRQPGFRRVELSLLSCDFTVLGLCQRLGPGWRPDLGWSLVWPPGAFSSHCHRPYYPLRRGGSLCNDSWQLASLEFFWHPRIRLGVLRVLLVVFVAPSCGLFLLRLADPMGLTAAGRGVDQALPVRVQFAPIHCRGAGRPGFVY